MLEELKGKRKARILRIDQRSEQARKKAKGKIKSLTRSRLDPTAPLLERSSYQLGLIQDGLWVFQSSFWCSEERKREGSTRTNDEGEEVREVRKGGERTRRAIPNVQTLRTKRDGVSTAENVLSEDDITHSTAHVHLLSPFHRCALDSSVLLSSYCRGIPRLADKPRQIRSFSKDILPGAFPVVSTQSDVVQSLEGVVVADSVGSHRNYESVNSCLNQGLDHREGRARWNTQLKSDDKAVEEG